MRQYFILFLFLLPLCKLSAQNTKLPEFGKVDPSELQLKECSFDKNAGAMVLFSEGESLFKLDLNVTNPVFRQTEYHVRIKIFKKDGFDQANVKLLYPIRSDVSIKHLSAQTYNLDASGNVVVTKVDKSVFFDKHLNTRFAQKIFAFPDVKEGSVIEYKYTIDGFAGSNWYFQKSIPVKFSRFITNLPAELIMAANPNVSLPMKTGTGTDINNNVSWYEMENVPALRDEPFMSSDKDYLQRIETREIAVDLPNRPRINLVNMWPEIVMRLMKDQDFGEQLKKNIPRTADLDAMLQNVTDPYQKMRIIHRYVRKNMEWNDYDNIWALNGVKTAWKDKKGTSGEINLILINLLKDAGLNTHAILVSTVENGVINTGVPGYDQFNKVMAYVEIANKHYVLDAVEKTTPSYLIPSEVMASEGLLISNPESGEWGWKTLWDADHKIDKTITISASVDVQGTLKGTAAVRSADYARVKLLPLLKQSLDKEKEAFMSVPEMKIDSLVVENMENDTLPIVQSFNFNMPTSSSSDYHYFSANLFSGFEKNPFIADHRQTDVFYGVAQDYTIDCVVSLPDGFAMDDLPKNVKLITPDTSVIFSRRSEYQDGLLSVLMHLEFKSPIYPMSDYDTFKEFYKKLFGFLNDKYVYKKK